MHTQTMNMFAETNEDMPIISGAGRTEVAAPRPVQPISFNVFTHSPLDWMDRELRTTRGNKVRIERGMTNFVVYMDGAIAFESDNIFQVCYFLNQTEVGI